ncbi:nucleotidyltransferase family protein [Hyphomicrobium sp.]|uniref:nucleotidyltransferase family protein n=1 Tax=Hyphomicrobium sp. TaxID=82 RepID=UPI000FB55DF5|nr:nucleotidyltransferase family protein [Hyphomicrobium sp.]MBN9247923.1 nucleotidyltransferase family protein [Hyphomicrobium sp.]RUP09172.1 MAG: nucleotidyltransferase family protein [Hyphomicrobium sp.]
MTVVSRVAAVLLAAGSSERFGSENKLLAEIGGEPLLRRVTRVVIGAGLSEIVVVTGHEAERCRSAVEGLAVRFVHNAACSHGMGSSVAVGIGALGDEFEGAFIVPTDMPFLTSALFTRLWAAFEASDGRGIVFPVTVAGEQRNPVLWPRAYFPELRALVGTTGAKALLRKYAAQSRGIPLASDEEATDIDTLADLAAACDQPRPL